VLLPTGHVFICGGVSVDNEDVNFSDDDQRKVLTAELFDPLSGNWSTLPDATVTRNYNSVALLMPDGRVWTAGSNKNGNYSFRHASHGIGGDEPGVDFRELRIEIFEPWYYSSGRPRIVSPSPTEVYYGEAFSIGFESSADITSAAMIRAGSVTHAFNPDQRYVMSQLTFKDLKKIVSFEATATAAITATANTKKISRMSKGCGQEIYFDANNNKSQSGKFIPLSKETGLPHQCQ
jgi:hypothetical protein